MKQIKINGLLWDAENTEIKEKTHFTFNEAQEAAKLAGRRLPTREEYEALVSLWTRWDDVRKGHRFQDDEGNEIFFPAAGVVTLSSKGPKYIGSNGEYWSGSNDDWSGYYLSTSPGHANPTALSNKHRQCSVRCVQDINK